MTLLVPNGELVAQAWVYGTGAVASGQVAATLPDDTAWTNGLFVQVMQLSGDVDIELPIFETNASINVFAKADGASLKPPWNKAYSIAQAIWWATLKAPLRGDPACDVVLPHQELYAGAVVRTVRALSEPKRIPSDPSQYAVVNMDIGISWGLASGTLVTQ